MQELMGVVFVWSHQFVPTIIQVGMAKRNVTPVRQEIVRAAESHDRHKILRAVCPRVPPGTLRFADVPKILAANVDKCKVAVKIWDAEAAKRETDGICKGLFMASYRTNHFFRRCDASAEKGDYCNLCTRMRKKAEGSEDVTLSGFQE